jgi:hypothetical protein
MTHFFKTTTTPSIKSKKDIVYSKGRQNQYRSECKRILRSDSSRSGSGGGRSTRRSRRPELDAKSLNKHDACLCDILFAVLGNEVKRDAAA